MNPNRYLFSVMILTALIAASATAWTVQAQGKEAIGLAGRFARKVDINRVLTLSEPLRTDSYLRQRSLST